MLFPFVHHQLEGETRWFIIPRRHLSQLYDLAAEMYGALYDAAGETPARIEERAIMGRALLYSKQLFPPLSLLTKHGIPYHTITLRAGQILTASGGDAHFGFSTVPGRTVAVATNVATSAWLEHGLPFVHEHFKWIAETLKPWWTSTGQNLKVAKGSPAGKRGLMSHLAMVDKCISLCPPNFACSFVRGINADLAAIQSGVIEPVCEYASEDVKPKDLAVLRARCSDILRLIHQSRNFVKTISALECPGCSSSGAGAAEECTCMHCLCLPTDMNHEWLEVSLPTLQHSDAQNPSASSESISRCSTKLTLQHPHETKWQATVAASDVHLLLAPSSTSNQLKEQFLKRGVAYVPQALSLTLLDELDREVVPWLDCLLAEMANIRGRQSLPTGLTIEITPNSIREAETGLSLPDHPATPPVLTNLLVRLRNDPCLTTLIAWVAPAGAAIYEAIYVRLRLPGHYTKLHADHSFFAEENLLPAEPVCTAWIPLRPCAPASGALLLLPDTHGAIPLPTKLVPPHFNRQVWNSIGQVNGCQVASADMAAGDALLFSPTVLHGGATRDHHADSTSGARYSIDLRILAKPSSRVDPRTALVTSVASAICATESKGLAAITISNLLNNVFLFHLLLRHHASTSPLRTAVQAVMNGARTRLGSLANNFDAQQRLQFHMIWPDDGPNAQGGPAGMDIDGEASAVQAASIVEPDSIDNSASVKLLATMLAALRTAFVGVADRESVAAKASEPTSTNCTSWTKLLQRWTTIICFQAIEDGHGHSVRLQTHCQFLSPLWELLAQHPYWLDTLLLKGSSIKTDCPWKGLVVALLYLATHCIYAQTFYQTHPGKSLNRIIGYSVIAQLLSDTQLLDKLRSWNHAELLAEIIAVRLCHCIAHSHRDVNAAS